MSQNPTIDLDIAALVDTHFKTAEQLASETAPTEPTGTLNSEFPAIVVNKRQDRDILSDAIDIIRQINERNPKRPILYVRAGILSQIAVDEKGVHFIRNAEGAILSKTLIEQIDWVKQYRDKAGDIYFDDTPVPERIVKMLEVVTDWSHVPALEGIALAPVFAPDGTLHAEPGYNSATRLYNAGGVEIGDTDPTDENLKRAKQLLMGELMGEFPFVDDASRAHALALLLLPFVRPMISGATPNHLIDAPTPGTGKSLLADLCTIPFASGQKSTISLTKSEDEFSKAIITALLSGRSYVCIDNLPQSAILDSAKLASAITESEIADRTMRTHTAMMIRPRCGWITTGNNTKLSLELTRRTVQIRLDRNSETPWNTENFKHADIRSWALEHRAELATAAIAIIRRWIACGRPKFTGKPKGSFSEWAQTMGGILQCAGVPGFLGNEQEMFENSAQGNNELWRPFVDAWYTKYRDLSVKVGELFRLASHADKKQEPDDTPDSDEWLGLLDEELQGLPESGRRRRFGRLMEERRDVVIGGYKMTKGKIQSGSTTWILRKV